MIPKLEEDHKDVMAISDDDIITEISSVLESLEGSISRQRMAQAGGNSGGIHKIKPPRVRLS